LCADLPLSPGRSVRAIRSHNGDTGKRLHSPDVDFGWPRWLRSHRPGPGKPRVAALLAYPPTEHVRTDRKVHVIKKRAEAALRPPPPFGYLTVSKLHPRWFKISRFRCHICPTNRFLLHSLESTAFGSKRSGNPWTVNLRAVPKVRTEAHLHTSSWTAASIAFISMFYRDTSKDCLSRHRLKVL